MPGWPSIREARERAEFASGGSGSPAPAIVVTCDEQAQCPMQLQADIALCLPKAHVSDSSRRITGAGASWFTQPPKCDGVAVTF